MSNAATVALAALVPIIILVLTSFVKISIVLSLLRNAIGSQDAPSSLVITGISLVLTMFVMGPVAIDMVKAAETPAPLVAPADSDAMKAIKQLVPEDRRADVDTAARAVEPMRAWLGKHADKRDRDTFVDLAARMKNTAKGDEIWILAPAFLTTELREAFAIALLLFVPFLVIDLVVGLSLSSLGLANTSPQSVALPVKLLLFVAVDGWRLLVEGLLRGYA